MRKKSVLSILAMGMGALFAPGLRADTIQFSITNTSPADGIWIMRPWIGLQDGAFQTYTLGQPAASGVQHIAEDGVTGDPANMLPPPNVCGGAPGVYTASSPCQFQVFNSYSNHGQQASIGNPTAPGATISGIFVNVDPNDPNSQVLSYLVMLVPTNDAFFGTDTAHPIQLFTNGIFNAGKGSITIPVFFSDILDAGTEFNTESSTDTAFLGQSVNGTGTHPDTNPVIHRHDLFGNGILTGSNNFGGRLNRFDQANFQGQIALITISDVPEPGSMALLGVGMLGLWGIRKFQHAGCRG